MKDELTNGELVGGQHCCAELADRLGKGNEYPKPAYISPEDWERDGHLDWWYPGADGPGYYMIHELEEVEMITTPAGVYRALKIEYRRMMECPYCGDVKRVICPECGASIPPDGHCWYCENAPDEGDDEIDWLGTCCGCGGSENVRNIICLDQKGPTPGKGWGCLVCGLPPDGAIAVLCDECLKEGIGTIRFVCIGYPASDGRMPIEELATELFTHDAAYHIELNEDGVGQGPLPR